MKLVIFGLTVSSSWGNGHATLWRGLCRALARRGHDVHFYERDVPYYAAHRDLDRLEGCSLRLYPDWSAIEDTAARTLADADVSMVTSYCPDALVATRLLLDAPRPLHCFYDLDTPVTLDRLERAEPVDYIGTHGLRDFDLVLSYTGGDALSRLQSRLGARRVHPLYGSVDPQAHAPVPPAQRYRCDLSYLGTYAADRQEALERLFLEPARRLPDRRFLIAGALYPPDFPWRDNIAFIPHLSPADHPVFFSSSRLTTNVTRRAMARMGYCPSGRLFEAAACGTPVLSDVWEGLDQFFEPGREILTSATADGAIAALEASDGELTRIGRAARERTLAQHTAGRRAAELEHILDASHGSPSGGTRAADISATVEG